MVSLSTRGTDWPGPEFWVYERSFLEKWLRQVSCNGWLVDTSRCKVWQGEIFGGSKQWSIPFPWVSRDVPSASGFVLLSCFLLSSVHLGFLEAAHCPSLTSPVGLSLAFSSLYKALSAHTISSTKNSTLFFYSYQSSLPPNFWARFSHPQVLSSSGGVESFEAPIQPHREILTRAHKSNG